MSIIGCPKCGHRLITATAEIASFEVDSEPYKAGAVEDCGFTFVEAYFSIGINWCPECCKVRYAWLAEAPFGIDILTK